MSRESKKKKRYMISSLDEGDMIETRPSALNSNMLQ